jgi:hypothetical protein
MVPWMTLPFFSSICTVSFTSFIKNLRPGAGSTPDPTLRPLARLLAPRGRPPHLTSLTMAAGAPAGAAHGLLRALCWLPLRSSDL